MKKTFSLSDSVCLYTNIKELSCADLDEEFVFFGCRRMLIRQKFIKNKGRAILDEKAFTFIDSVCLYVKNL